MNLEVIGVGFGRTGTKSTYMALNELGYNCYHMEEVLLNKENKNHLDFWLEVSDGKSGQQYEWSTVFKNYNATLDNPACCVWKELIETYPDAKVLLTLHPKGAEGWYTSTIETVYAPEKKWGTKCLKFLIPRAKKYFTMSSKLIWDRNHRGTMENKDKAIERYNEHIEEIRCTIQKEKLLVYSVVDGWEPLCNFLGKEIPKTEFPRINDKKKLRKGLIVAYIILLLFSLTSAWLIYGIISLIS